MKRMVVFVLLISGVALGAERPAAEQAAGGGSMDRASQAFAKAVEIGDDALTLAGQRYRWVGDQWLLDRISARRDNGGAVRERSPEESAIRGNAICLIIKPISCAPRP